MKTTINLATRPYVELREVFKKLRIAMGVLAVLAIGLGIWVYVLNKKHREEQAKLDAIHAQTAKLQAERAANEAKMKQPANAAELVRSQFLNELFAKKAFSWTAVLMDLEDVLPAGLQVSSIEPQIHPTGDVLIRLHVAGERDKAVDLVRNLEKSKRFIAPRLAGESSQQKQQNGANANRYQAFNGNTPITPGGVEFDIIAGYNPLQERETKKKVDAKAEKKTVTEVKR